MKTTIATVLLSLMIGGVIINAQEHKGNQQPSPAKTEKCSGTKASSCCQEMKEKSCTGMDQKATGNKSDQTKKATKETAIVYTCTMHLEVKSDKPGKCPKCGMELVIKK